MSSTNVSDSGSTRSPKSTCRLPTPNHRYSDSSCVRCSGASASVSKKISRPTTNAAATVRDTEPVAPPVRAAAGEQQHDAPSAGSANSSQARDAVPVAGDDLGQLGHRRFSTVRGAVHGGS